MAATRILSRPDGPALAIRRARLKVTRGPSRGAVLELDSPAPVVIGSGEDAELLLDDDTVSERHAELRPTARGWVVRDLGSTNGVRVDDVRVIEAGLDGKSRRLRPGERGLGGEVAGGEGEPPVGAPVRGP